MGKKLSDGAKGTAVIMAITTPIMIGLSINDAIQKSSGEEPPRTSSSNPR